MLCLGRARLFRGLLAHPLVVAPVVAGALGDPFIGVFVGIGLAFLWERDDSPGGLAPLNGAIGSAVGAAVGVSMYERIGLGGVVIEPMTGIVVGALAGLSLQIWDNKREGGEEPATPPLLETLQTAARTSVGSLLGILGCIALWDWDPSFIRNWAPWTSGAILAISLGGLAGRRLFRGSASPEAVAVGRMVDLRSLALIGAIAALNHTGYSLAGAVLGVYVVLFLLLELRDRRKERRGEKLALSAAEEAWADIWGAVLRLGLPPAAVLLGLEIVWLPWQLPAHEMAWFPGPVEGAVGVGGISKLAVTPMLLGVGALGAAKKLPLTAMLVVGFGLMYAMMNSGV